MKFLGILFFIAFFSLAAQSQVTINYGIKAGLNYDQFDDLAVTGTIAGLDERVSSDSKLGFHIGAYSQIDLTKVYFRPELVFTSIKNTYNDELAPATDLKISTLELPLLMGVKLVKPLSVYVGPSLIYTLDTKFSEFFELDLEKKLTLGLNLGAAVNLNKLRLDLRYTRGLSENLASYFEAITVDGAGYAIDTRPDMWILSLSIDLN